MRLFLCHPLYILCIVWTSVCKAAWNFAVIRAPVICVNYRDCHLAWNTQVYLFSEDAEYSCSKIICYKSWSLTLSSFLFPFNTVFFRHQPYNIANVDGIFISLVSCQRQTTFGKWNIPLQKGWNKAANKQKFHEFRYQPDIWIYSIQKPMYEVISGLPFVGLEMVFFIPTTFTLSDYGNSHRCWKEWLMTICCLFRVMHERNEWKNNSVEIIGKNWLDCRIFFFELFEEELLKYSYFEMNI